MIVRYFPAVISFTEVTSRQIWFVSSAACDLLIAISTFYFLKRKKTYFKPTETTITRVIRVTVETGLICAACAILELVMFLAFANDTFYMPLCLSLSKLYSNSLLAVRATYSSSHVLIKRLKTRFSILD